MLNIALLLILVIGLTYTLLWSADFAGNNASTSTQPVLSEGSSALLQAV